MKNNFIELKAPYAIFFDVNLVHGCYPNKSNDTRFSLAWEYLESSNKDVLETDEHWNDRKDHIVCNYELAGGTKLNIKITSTIDQNVEDESVGFTNLKIFGEENAQVVPKTSRSTKTDAEFAALLVMFVFAFCRIYLQN